MKQRVNKTASRRRGIALVFLAAAAVLVVSFAAVYWMGLVALQSNRQLGRQREVIAHLESVLSTVKDAETGQRGYLLTGEARYLQPYEKALREVNGELAELGRLATEGELPGGAVSEVNRLTGEKLAELEQTVKLKQEGNAARALEIVRSNRGERAMDDLRSVVAGMEKREVEEFEQAKRRAERATYGRIWTFLGAALVSVGFLGWAYRRVRGEMKVRETAQEELRHSEQRYRSFVEASAQVIWRTNARGEVDEPIPSWNAFTGQSEQEAAGFGWINAIEPEDRPRVTEAWRMASGARRLYEVEYRLKRHDGRWLHILARGVPVLETDGRVREYIGSCIDVTEQRQAEAELRKQARLIDLAPAATMVRALDGTIRFWSDGAERVYGWTRPEAIGRRSHELLQTEFPEPLERIIAEIREKGRWSGDLRHVTREGRRVVVESHWLGRFGRDGELSELLESNMDITARTEMEEALRRLKGELEERVEERTAALAAANKELEAFGYSVSHDLRAPLRHVSSYIKLLAKGSGANLDEKGQKQVRTIAEAAERMGHLIDDLLVLSRIGRATLKESELSLRGLVDEARKELAPEMAGRAIEWRVGPLPEVCGDSSLLRSAVVNLLSNAIKYSRQRNPARIEVGSQAGDGEVVCFVRDNGAGFDMQFIEKLFGVFQRLHDRDQFEGTGIGLASVRRIIQRHGGRTWAEGAVEQGATFYFSIPMERVVQVGSEKRGDGTGSSAARPGRAASERLAA